MPKAPLRAARARRRGRPGPRTCRRRRRSMSPWSRVERDRRRVGRCSSRRRRPAASSRRRPSRIPDSRPRGRVAPARDRGPPACERVTITASMPSRRPLSVLQQRAARSALNSGPPLTSARPGAWRPCRARRRPARGARRQARRAACRAARPPAPATSGGSRTTVEAPARARRSRLSGPTTCARCRPRRAVRRAAEGDHRDLRRAGAPVDERRVDGLGEPPAGCWQICRLQARRPGCGRSISPSQARLEALRGVGDHARCRARCRSGCRRRARGRQRPARRRGSAPSTPCGGR